MTTSISRLSQAVIACLREHGVKPTYRMVHDIVNAAKKNAPDTWSETPPNHDGWWWWYVGTGEPVPVSIQYSPAANRYFASTGQHGWTQAQWVDDMGGVWQMSSVQKPIKESTETVTERAKKLVAKTEATYDAQVKDGKYLCDKPMGLDEAISYLKEQDENEGI